MSNDVKLEIVEKEPFRLIGKNFLTAKITDIPIDKIEERCRKHGLYEELLEYSENGSLYQANTDIGNEETKGYDESFIMFHNTVLKNDKPLPNAKGLVELIIPKLTWAVISIINPYIKDEDVIDKFCDCRRDFFNEKRYGYSMKIEVFYFSNGRKLIPTELWFPIEKI